MIRRRSHRATGARSIACPSLGFVVAASLGACAFDETPASIPPPLQIPAATATAATRRAALGFASDRVVNASVTARRRVVVIHSQEPIRDLLAVGISRFVVDALDAAFVGRVDLLAELRPGATLTLWTYGDDVVAAKVEIAKKPALFAARYTGPLAPIGFYDAAGGAMVGPILSRPVTLSRITSRFGARFDSIAGHRAEHHGIDYGVVVGTPVMSVGDGRVKVAATSATAGTFIEITHASGYESRYLHLSEIDPLVRVGAVVHQGQVIGRSGNTGRSTGPHLHYELHLAGIPLDPLATLPIPAVALGPTARREHLAFMNQLEAQDDGRADEQDEHPRAQP